MQKLNDIHRRIEQSELTPQRLRCDKSNIAKDPAPGARGERFSLGDKSNRHAIHQIDHAQRHTKWDVVGAVAKVAAVPHGCERNPGMNQQGPAMLGHAFSVLNGFASSGNRPRPGLLNRKCFDGVHTMILHHLSAKIGPKGGAS